MVRIIPLGWPCSIRKCRSIFVEYSHWSGAGRFAIIESTLELFLATFRHFWLFKLRERNSKCFKLEDEPWFKGVQTVVMKQAKKSGLRNFLISLQFKKESARQLCEKKSREMHIASKLKKLQNPWSFKDHSPPLASSYLWFSIKLW